MTRTRHLSKKTALIAALVSVYVSLTGCGLPGGCGQKNAGPPPPADPPPSVQADAPPPVDPGGAGIGPGGDFVGNLGQDDGRGGGGGAQIVPGPGGGPQLQLPPNPIPAGPNVPAAPTGPRVALQPTQPQNPTKFPDGTPYPPPGGGGNQRPVTPTKPPSTAPPKPPSTTPPKPPSTTPSKPPSTALSKPPSTTPSKPPSTRLSPADAAAVARLRTELALVTTSAAEARRHLATTKTLSASVYRTEDRNRRKDLVGEMYVAANKAIAASKAARAAATRLAGMGVPEAAAREIHLKYEDARRAADEAEAAAAEAVALAKEYKNDLSR